MTRAAVLIVALLLVALFAILVHKEGETVRARESVRVIETNGPPLTLPANFDPKNVAELIHPSTTVREVKSKQVMEVSWHGHACGGDLPPCYVMRRESGGDVNAYNPRGCGGRGCYGKWQCDPRTCSGRGSEAQQDDEARALWDHGKGCQHWDACR